MRSAEGLDGLSVHSTQPEAGRFSEYLEGLGYDVDHLFCQKALWTSLGDIPSEWKVVVEGDGRVMRGPYHGTGLVQAVPFSSGGAGRARDVRVSVPPAVQEFIENMPNLVATRHPDGNVGLVEKRRGPQEPRNT